MMTVGHGTPLGGHAPVGATPPMARTVVTGNRGSAPLAPVLVGGLRRLPPA